MGQCTHHVDHVADGDGRAGPFVVGRPDVDVPGSADCEKCRDRILDEGEVGIGVVSPTRIAVTLGSSACRSTVGMTARPL